MYGKGTRLRIAQEEAWGEVPSSGWIEAAPSDSGLSLSSRAATSKRIRGRAAGVVYAVANVTLPPTEDNLTGLAEAGLLRDAYGEMKSYTLQAADGAGAAEVRGAVARRLRVRAGIARPALEFAFEFVGKASGECAAFDAGGGGKPFTFAGASLEVDLAEAAVREFSIAVNNNLFIGPSDGDDDPLFLSAGRQEVTGYVIVADDRRDLVDGDVHALSVSLPGLSGGAVITAGEVLFTWAREIRTLVAGALQVLYFEGASGAIDGSVTVGLEA